MWMGDALGEESVIKTRWDKIHSNRALSEGVISQALPTSQPMPCEGNRVCNESSIEPWGWGNSLHFSRYQQPSGRLLVDCFSEGADSDSLSLQSRKRVTIRQKQLVKVLTNFYIIWTILLNRKFYLHPANVPAKSFQINVIINIFIRVLVRSLVRIWMSAFRYNLRIPRVHPISILEVSGQSTDTKTLVDCCRSAKFTWINDCRCRTSLTWVPSRLRRVDAKTGRKFFLLQNDRIL